MRAYTLCYNATDRVVRAWGFLVTTRVETDIELCGGGGGCGKWERREDDEN